MTVLVTDAGFRPAPARADVALADVRAATTEVALQNTDDPALLAPYLETIRVIRVAFPSFADGRAFTIGRRLRMLGYKGELIAHGHVIADQYAMCRRVGFDAVEISDELAQRQPVEQWQFRAQDWAQHHYQARLRA